MAARVTLQELRAEYEAVGIGPIILGLVRELAGAVARGYPPGVYNDGAPWSKDRLDDLAQQVVLDRLLAEGQLEYLFDRATSVESWRRLLSFQVRRTLSRRRRKTVVDCLLARIRRLALVSPFRTQVVGRTVWVSYEGFRAPLLDLQDSRIAEAANAARGIPQLTARERSTRASMVYTTPDLRMLLERVLEEVGAVNERDLARILEVLLTSHVRTLLQDPEGDYPSDDPSPDVVVEDTEMRSAVQTFVDDLSQAERWILLGKSQSIADREIAARLGRSRPWIAQQKHRVLDRLGRDLLSQFEADRHFPTMETLLDLISDSLGEVQEG